jgi:hypothetical protein
MCQKMFIITFNDMVYAQVIYLDCLAINLPSTTEMVQYNWSNERSEQTVIMKFNVCWM